MSEINENLFLIRLEIIKQHFLPELEIEAFSVQILPFILQHHSGNK
jgi:hypothetical protein